MFRTGFVGDAIMITEAMVLLIVVGLLLMILARVSFNRREEAKEKELYRSTDTLKKELERTGSTIIQRMGTHVSKLERLIREAETENGRILSRLDEVTSVRDSLQQVIAEARALQQQLLEQQRMMAMYRPPTYEATLPPPQNRRADFADMLNASIAREQTAVNANNGAQFVPSQFQRFNQTVDVSVDGEIDDEEIDDEEIEEYIDEEVEEEVDDEIEEEIGEETDEDGDEDDEDDGEEGDEESDADNEEDARQRARVMLREGKTVKETMRETGMGRSAVELLSKMIKK